MNNRSIAPLPLSAGGPAAPPVDTTVAAPEVSVSTSRLVTVCVPLIASGMLDELVYVMELAVELEKAKISPPVGPEPSVALPLALMSLRMPKYTFECEPRLTEEHVTVAPPVTPVVPLTEQEPPPGSV